MSRNSPEINTLLLLLLHHVVQASDMGQDLHHKLVAAMEGQFGLATPADAGWCSGDTRDLR